MKKRIFALVLVSVMVFALSACSFSSDHTTTTTFSSSKTDADGNTTTQTVTNEIGISAGPDGIQTKNETTTEETTTAAGSMADFFLPKEDWYDFYSEGGEGENEDGDVFYFAYDDPDDITEAILLIAFADGDIMVRNGKVLLDEEEDCLELYDVDVDKSIPFVFLETDEENCFTIHFLANDTTVMFEFVDQDTIISDIYDVLSNTVPNTQIADEAEDAG